jgi:preprotein translocase subunit SecB
MMDPIDFVAIYVARQQQMAAPRTRAAGQA